MLPVESLSGHGSTANHGPAAALTAAGQAATAAAAWAARLASSLAWTRTAVHLTPAGMRHRAWKAAHPTHRRHLGSWLDLQATLARRLTATAGLVQRIGTDLQAGTSRDQPGLSRVCHNQGPPIKDITKTAFTAISSWQFLLQEGLAPCIVMILQTITFMTPECAADEGPHCTFKEVQLHMCLMVKPGMSYCHQLHSQRLHESSACLSQSLDGGWNSQHPPTMPSHSEKSGPSYSNSTL